MAALAAQKYPKNAQLWALKAQNERGGPAARRDASLQRALAIDPKAQALQMVLAQIYVDRNQPEAPCGGASADVAAERRTRRATRRTSVSLGGNAYKAAEGPRSPRTT